jgi:hypothetical protein
LKSFTQGAKQSCVELAAELLPDAEKELAAYTRAVQELSGSEQARQSIEDWMAELDLIDWPSGDSAPDWRRLTIAAAIRLAIRVNAPGLNQTSGF